MATAYPARLCLSCASSMVRSPCPCAPAHRHRIRSPARLSSQLCVAPLPAFAAPPVPGPFSSEYVIGREQSGIGVSRGHSGTPDLVTSSTWIVSVLHGDLLAHDHHPERVDVKYHVHSRDAMSIPRCAMDRTNMDRQRTVCESLNLVETLSNPRWDRLETVFEFMLQKEHP